MEKRRIYRMGRKYYKNGDILEGKFVNGEINGKGILKKKKVYILENL